MLDKQISIYRYLVMIPTHRQGLCPGCPRPGPGVVMVEDEVLAVLVLVDWAHLTPSCTATLNTVQHVAASSSLRVSRCGQGRR